jgi:hypothetical protein
MAEHLLTGWHRGIAAGKRVERWLQERKDALKSALSSLPGGKNVYEYMLQCGWLEFGPQVKAVKTQRHVKWSKLKNYDVAIILKSKKNMSIGAMMVHSVMYIKVALLDRRLNVRSMNIETPIMFADGLTVSKYPSEFTIHSEFGLCDDLDRQVFFKQLRRLSDRVNESITQLPVMREYREEHQRRRPYYLDNDMVRGSLFHSEQHFKTKRDSVYPKYREDGSKHTQHRRIETGDSVRLLVQLNCLVCNVEQYPVFYPSWKIQQLQTMNRPNVSAMFISDDEED